jgi:chorismate mutase
MNNPLVGPGKSVDTPKKNLRTRPSAIALWQPDIVVPDRTIVHRPILTAGEPSLRPEATRAQVDETRLLLASLAERRAALGRRVAAADVRAREASSDRERVSAVFESYRAQSELDDVLTGTMKQLTTLMKDRGLR